MAMTQDETYMDEELDQEATVSDGADAAEEAGETAVLPRSFCPDMPVGSIIKARIDRILEDEILVSLIKGDKDKQPVEYEPAPAPEDALME